MRQSRAPTVLTVTFMAVLLVAGVIFVATMAGFAMPRGGWGMGGWGMGGGHMGHMGGGTNSSNAAVSVGGQSEVIAIRDFAYSPGNLQVPVGAIVTFTNYDSAPHTATAKDGSWDTGIRSKGESKTITFGKAGDYTYYCTVHPSMVARLQVR